MQLGIFAKTFVRPTVEEVFQAVAAQGLKCVQFNMACAGLPPLPEHIDRETCERIRNSAADRGIEIPAISGTFNMIHPDHRERSDGLRRLGVLAAACHEIGATVITLCTGSRDAQDMWRPHPDNDTASAWRDLVASIREALQIVDNPRLTLAFEPEAANVIDTAKKARRLIDEIASPRLRVVFDAANLLQAANLHQMSPVLDEAFELLGQEIVIAHAKDVRMDRGKKQLTHVPAGAGVLDYDRYLGSLQSLGFQGPLILHGLPESEVRTCVAFLQRKLAKSDENQRGWH